MSRRSDPKAYYDDRPDLHSDPFAVEAPSSDTPWKKRWPGQYAMKATFVTPMGSVLEFETDVPKELIEPFLTAVAEYMGKGNEPR